MLFGCASDEQFRDELSEEIFSRPLNVVTVNQWQHDNPPSRKDTYLEEIEDLFRDPKCDYCNCALRDCSLCGSGAEG